MGDPWYIYFNIRSRPLRARPTGWVFSSPPPPSVFFSQLRLERLSAPLTLASTQATYLPLWLTQHLRGFSDLVALKIDRKLLRTSSEKAAPLDATLLEITFFFWRLKT